MPFSLKLLLGSRPTQSSSFSTSSRSSPSTGPSLPTQPSLIWPGPTQWCSSLWVTWPRAFLGLPFSGTTSTVSHLSTCISWWGASPFAPPAGWVCSRPSSSAPEAPVWQSSNVNPHDLTWLPFSAYGSTIWPLAVASYSPLLPPLMWPRAIFCFVTESCSLWPQNYFLRQIFFTLVAFQDVTFLGLMALSSGYMVLLLWRHKRQSTLHSNSTKRSSKASPEKRAMQSILLLVGLFVAMYCVDCAVSSPRTVWYSEPVRLYVQILMANGYATISPLLLISTENRMITFFKSCWEGK